MIDFLIKINLASLRGTIEFQFIHSPSNIIKLSSGFNTLFLWGDPIFPNNKQNNAISEWEITKLLTSIKGHFYFLKLNSASNTLIAGVSLFNILPVYFSESASHVFLSANPNDIASQLPTTSKNKRFILENILFNYQLFNQSCFKEINLIPANNYLRIEDNKVILSTHTSTESLFVANPKPWKKSAYLLSEIFIDSSKHYFPDDPFAISLTGGFDGRTLTSCGLHFGQNFSTYSFGTADYDDVIIARKISEKAGLNYENINLNNSYIQNESLPDGLDFIKGAAGGAGFARAHYLFAAKILAAKYKTILTGNFGSELFRALHNAGAVISPNLQMFFSAKDYNEAILLLSSSQEFCWLNRNNFNSEWEDLKEDIKTLPCFNPHFKTLTKNQQFYKLVFDEVFRKYFGAELVNQYKYLINRTPFLDYTFIKEILQTEMAGVSSDFFTHNPFKRFKGQVLYAHIIQKTYPGFSTEMTDKGYRPVDLLSLSGNFKIGQSFLKKQIYRTSKTNSDPYSVTAAFNHNKDFWEQVVVDSELFSSEHIKNAFNNSTNSKDSFYLALSQVWWANYLKIS